MNLIKRLFAYGYLFIMASVGLFFILIGLKYFSLESVPAVASSFVYSDAVFIASGAVILATGLVIPFNVIKDIRRNRIITFRNPDGEVNITIFAIEDYIQKIAKDIPNVSAMKPTVSFGRKGINIKGSVSLSAGANIPEVTEKVQMQVKNSLRSMLGIDEEISMTIHVSKIVGSAAPEERYYGESGPTHVPYR